MQSNAYDVFISYRSNDLHLAEDLHDSLTREGFRVWFDRARLDPGCDWHREIETACEGSRIILPIMTPTWQESEWCRFETFGGEQVIPLLFAGDWSQIAPSPLQAYQFVDFRHPQAATWNKLLAAIRDYLRQPLVHKTPRLAFLAYSHNPYFVGREKLLLDIHEHLCRTAATALTQGSAYAISGMGGIGKTTLAREYAEKFWRLYREILWVRAEPEMLPTEFARLALQLRLVSQPSRDNNEDAQRAMQELNGRTPRLLILDNAIDEKSVQEWIPNSGGCRTIVTSRFAGWSAAVQTVTVGVLAPAPARELLLRRSGLEKSDVNIHAADRVGEELGYLPLALEQAAAFARKVCIGFEQYLVLYAQSRRELLAQRALGGTQYPDSVATTWQTTIKRLGWRARAVLRLAAFCSPENIPFEMLQEAGEFLGKPITTRVSEIMRHISRYFVGQQKTEPVKNNVLTMKLDLRLALGELADYSMISLSEHAFSVHRLVQAVQIDSLKERVRRTWAKRAVLGVNRAFPYIEFSDWAYCARLLPHARVAATLIEHWQFKFPEAWRLLNQAASYLLDRGQYSQAELLFRQALEVRCSLGEHDPDFATALDALGLVQSLMGNYAAAEPLHQRALEIRRAILGYHHPDFATSLNNLAVLYGRTGKYAASEPLHQMALQARCAVFGKHHKDVAESMNNLAVLYDKLHNYAAAEPLYRQALEIFRVTLGPENPKFAQLVNNLAVLYYRQGNYSAAEPLYREALEIRRTALGEDHPEFARTMSDLAVLYDQMDNHVDAEPLHRRAVEITRAALGEAHPLLAKALENYAASLRRIHHTTEASKMESQAREIRSKHTATEPHNG
jgi:tetratricopeptide (TPR) repeat protein